MTVRLIVLAAAVVILALAWFRSRRAGPDTAIDQDTRDRGVIGEIATAYEDVGRQFFDESSHRSIRSNDAGEAGNRN